MVILSPPLEEGEQKTMKVVDGFATQGAFFRGKVKFRYASHFGPKTRYARRFFKNKGRRKDKNNVDEEGIEPPTSRMRSARSTN